MSRLKENQQEYLKNKFGARVTLERLERKFYSHDLAEMPFLVKPLIGSTMPDAVVQPETEDELVEVVQWAAQHRVALTPRGMATSGYGGVLPVENGLVIDFYRMNRVITVDAAALTVTVQPGILWEQLDRALARHDLTLRLYPTSYPSSTVGGWLAHGGAGLGSYEAGWFPQNVVSARVVLPDGTVREFAGQDLDLIADVQGITGLISAVTLRVKPLEEMDVVAIACPDPYDVQELLEGIIAAKLPIWNMHFINPRMAEMKNQAPLMTHHEHPVEERVILPAAYVITIVCRAADRAAVMAGLEKLIEPTKAELLSARVAHHEWENRFKLMVVKRLGPSLVPTEVVIPLAEFGSVMEEIHHKIDQPIVKEGVVIRESTNGKPEIVILGFIPGDRRTLGYNFVFALSLSVVKIAERHGGRAYATGLYFTHRAAKILGAERVRRLRDFKRTIDPKQILNPGKVIGGRFISGVLALASLFEPLARPFGNAVAAQVGERPTKPVRGIPADVAWYAYSCSSCGYCVAECDQFYGRGWESQSPRGKWYWLREYMEGREEWNQFMVDTFLACTTCEMCDTRCSAALPIEPSWMKLRGALVGEQHRMTIPPFEMMGESLKRQGNIWAGYRQDRAAWFPEDLKEKHRLRHDLEAIYFGGCTASYVEHDIAQASVRLLDAAGVDFGYLGEQENCCGIPMLVSGKWDLFAKNMKRNIRVVQRTGAKTVITSCSACNMMWRHTYPKWAKKLGIDYDITAKHYSEVVAEKIQAGELTFPDNGRAPVTVTWHDSCHMGRASSIYEEPRCLIAAVPNVHLVEMEHNRATAQCCGSVMTMIKDPPIAAEVGEVRLREALDAGAEKILAACPCCEVQFRVAAEKRGVPIEVQDLAHFVAGALGYEFPDPHPEVQRQWGIFEAMIELMTPAGFAEIMESMWPEIVAAMPYGMDTMMKRMAQRPRLLQAMKPLFPTLFPRLMPQMMPQLIPVMMQRVEARIPMPDYMREQMPDLMPNVMNNLMPHMIGDVVPLVSQSLIDYLVENYGAQSASKAAAVPEVAADAAEPVGEMNETE